MRRKPLASLLMMEESEGKSQTRSEWEGERCSVDLSAKSDLDCEGKKKIGQWLERMQCREDCFDYFYIRRDCHACRETHQSRESENRRRTRSLGLMAQLIGV